MKNYFKLALLLLTILSGFKLYAQVPLLPLFEEFTSSTCGPCAVVNEVLDPILADNEITHSSIKYQVDWPGDGDPYYTEQNGVRVDYYGVSYAPALFINASENTSPIDMTQNLYESYLGGTTFIEIDITEAAIDDEHIASISVDIKALADYAAGLKAHVVIVEKRTVNNDIGSNGEEEFFSVAMRMLPSAEGTTLPQMITGQTEQISVSYDMDQTFMEGPNDLTVVVFVQDDLDKSIVQSGNQDIESSFETYALTFDVKDSGGSQVEGAKIFLEDQGNEYSNASGFHTYEGVFSGDFSYKVTYPGLFNAEGVASINGADQTVFVELEIPDYFYYEDFSIDNFNDYEYVFSGWDAVYWYDGRVIFFRQSGTLEPLMFISPAFDIAGNSGGELIYSIGGSYQDPEVGFGTISDPSDPGSISEIESYVPTEEFIEYVYDLSDYADTTDLVRFYWNHKTSNTSWFEMIFVIITKGEISAVEKDLLKQTKIFPNPAHDFVNVEMGLGIKKLSVYNFAGALVKDISLDTKEYQLHTGDLESGVYGILIESDKGRVLKKIMIQH